MDFQSTSPTSSSASSSPISIGWPSPTGSLSGSSRQEYTSSHNLNCAYPSWPTGHSLCSFGSSAPNSYISDEDLFLDDGSNAPFLYEAPAPPRPAPLPVAMPLLPLYASEKPKKRPRRRSSRKQHPAKPMTPISESPEAAPE